MTCSKPQGDDIRFFENSAVYWQGKGTYYLIEKLCVYCKVVCIEVLDIETERGSKLVYLTEEKVKSL